MDRAARFSKRKRRNVAEAKESSSGGKPENWQLELRQEICTKLEVWGANPEINIAMNRLSGVNLYGEKMYNVW